MSDPIYITRRLTWVDDKGNSHEELEENILDKFSQPLVVLGDPGLGKTWLMEKLGERDDCRFVRATSFLRWPDAPIDVDQRLVIDGLDEVAAAQEGDPLHNVLKKLTALGRPRFVLSCRSAEWNNVTANIDIAEDYTAKPKLLTLKPLSEDEAVDALSTEVASDKAAEAINRLREQGLAELYQNPLTLNFIKAIILDEGAIPAGRADLYEKAVTQLRLEQNDRHKASRLASLSLDQALDAAGATMATLLITGHQAITKGQNNDALQLSEIADFGDADKIRAILGSNLFRTDTVNVDHVLPLHRTVAEFLAARWLGRKMEAHPHPQRAASRLIGLLSAEGGLPASLRGMVAWLPKFSPAYLGPKIIEMDPYAVLRYGGGDGLSAEQSRAMISSLASLSEFDPFFRSDHWDRFSAKGLVQEGVQADLQALILSQEASPQLRSIILECLKGSGTAALLKDDLKAIAMDAARNYHERFVSTEALSDLDESSIEWSTMIEQLIALGDQSSTRLAVETMTIVGPEKFPPGLIAEAVIASSRILEKPEKQERSRTIGSYYRLGREVSDNQISPILDELTARVLPTRDPEKWWDYSYDDGWSEFCQLVDRLIYRQLDNEPGAVDPEQLWDWMRALERERDSYRDERKEIAKILAEEDRLRQGVQRLALFEPGTEEHFFSREHHLARLSGGLSLQNSDCKIHLAELVSRENPAERERWMTLVGRFRGDDGYIPKDIQAIARPYAGDDQQLLDFLTKKPKKRPLDDWEKRERRRSRDRKKRKEKNIAKSRENFTKNITAMRSGELGWIMNPAQAYLGMYSDLDREAEPDARVAEWLGDELRDAALVGFEAVLNRKDIPSAEQVAESAAESKVWNFIFPMLAGAGRRKRQDIPLHDLSDDLVSALAIGAEQQLLEQRQGLDGLQEWLVDELRERAGQYEKYLRQRFEPFFEAKSKHIMGLYAFTRSEDERPLSSQLCTEWLEKYGELPLEIERELVGCLVHAKDHERSAAWLHLNEFANSRLENISDDEDRRRFWLSILYMVDFDRAVDELPFINSENRDLLWLLSHSFYQRHGEEVPASASIKQLQWIVKKFRQLWPHTDRPNGVTSGDDNPWDATQLLEWAIFKIAADPSELATSALTQLRDMPEDGYTIHIQAAIARQHRNRLESRFRNPLSADLKAVLDDDPPKSAADVQAIVLEQLGKLQTKLQGDPFNIVNNFYDGPKPKTENESRDQMLIALGELPFGIQSPPEAAMPQGKRGDAAFTYQDIAVPLEAKGQWHKDVWTAASTQLDRLYATDYRAASKGIYVVFWFGPNAPAGKRLKKPPAGVTSPTTAEEMEVLLQATIPAHRQGDIKVVVLDLTRP